MVMKVLSLFCGCGGLDYGFHGHPAFEVVRSYDSMKHAVDTYNLNFPGVAVLGDVRQLLEPGFNLGFAPDVILGGPPCQDFSAAGKKTLGDRANLTETFIDIVCKYRPAFFVMENVPTIKTVGKSIYDSIVAKLRSACYGLSIQVIRMQDYGVPQKRRRLVIIGGRDGSDGMFDGLLKDARRPVGSMREYMQQTGIDLGFYSKGHIYRHPRSYACRGVFSIDELYPTVRGCLCKLPASYKFHPHDTCHDRDDIVSPDWSVIARIQTFPESYRFITTGRNNIVIIGNAVPPRFSQALANVLASIEI